ncbi:MAG: type II toxin-antitoxin system RelE/ParE family toxin [Terricaulis sp.]
MTKIEFAPRARRDLVDIEGYLTREAGSRRAKAVLARIRERIGQLAEQPRSGPERDDLRGRRALICRSYVAIYRLRNRDNGDIVVIVRIVHGARDLPALIED